VLDQPAETRSPARDRAFSLLGDAVPDKRAGRNWSDAYLVLTRSKRDRKDGPFRGQPDGPMVRWISAQSVPSMLPPKSAGSIRSGLLELLEKGHYDVRLSREEYERIACWIDLSVPYCADYADANIWNPEEMKEFLHFVDKRKRMDDLDRESVRHLSAGQPR
jgi:hypothetical protein